MGRTHKTYTDGLLTSEIPYTILEEIKADFEQEMRQIAKDAIGDVKPTTIEEFRLAYDAGKAVNGILTRRNINPDTLTAKEKKIISLWLEFYMLGVIYAHGKLPGADVA